MKITFIPNKEEFLEAALEYQEIWGQYGENIIVTWEKVTGLKFQESEIDATVYEGKSYSTPLHLRYDYELDRKKSVLIHELGHRLLSDYIYLNKSSLENHKNLYLVLYLVFEKLFGKEFADESVAWEKKLAPMYKEAWEWALSFTEIERGKRFKNLAEQ